MSRENRLFTYDGTIHAGHILTALTIAVCTAGAWFTMQEQLSNVREQVADIKLENKERDAQWRQDLRDINSTIAKGFDGTREELRYINEKLDKKQDKTK